MPVDMLVEPKLEDAFDLDLQVVEVTAPTDIMASQPPSTCSWSCTECFCTDVNC